MIQNGPLPDGWKWKKIGEIVTFEYGKGLTAAKRDPNGKTPVYGSNGIVGYHSTPLVERPCLIVGRKGAAGAVHKSDIPCWPIDTTYFVIPPEEINLSFLFYLLTSLGLNTLDRSTAIPGLNRNDVYAKRIPVPPLPEQERIVAKIEALFTQLDAGTAALRRIQAELKRYKASVLKAACEGRLVAQDPSDEPARTVNNSWKLVKLKDLADVIDPHPSHRTPPEYIGGISYVGMGDIKLESGVDLLNARKVHPRILDEHRARYQLKLGDFIFGKIGTIGKPYKIPEPFNYALSANVILVQPNHEAVNPNYLFYFMANPSIEHDLYVGSRATTQAAFGILKARELLIALPPLSEQRNIVNEIDRRFSVASEVEAAIEAALARSARLRQAILKRAFEGKLLDQRPEDAPVESLPQ